MITLSSFKVKWIFCYALTFVSVIEKDALVNNHQLNERDKTLFK